MKDVDVLIYEAIVADDSLMTAIGGQSRVKSTCFEVSPDEKDNTPLPNIIITDDGGSNELGTKDSIWESAEDKVQVSVEVAAHSPEDVKNILSMVRKAVNNHIGTLYDAGETVPDLESLTFEQLSWDWTRPCYYKRITYVCLTHNSTYDEENE